MKIYIKNSESIANSIIKYVGFSDNNGILSFNSVTRYERNTTKPDYGTYQEVCEGDFVIRSVFETSVVTTSKPVITLLVCNKVANSLKLEPVQMNANLFGLLSLCDKELMSWLITEGTVLPSGYGWDGISTKNDMVKQNKAMALLPDGLHENVVNTYIRAIPNTSAKMYEPETIYLGYNELSSVDFEIDKQSLILVNGASTTSVGFANSLKDYNPKDVLLVRYRKLIIPGLDKNRICAVIKKYHIS